MEKLYQESNGILHNVQMFLGQLERSGNESEAHKLMQDIHSGLRGLEQNTERLDILVSKEVPARRPMLRVKIDQLKADSQRVELATSTMYTRLTQKWRSATEREELLKQRYRPNESTTVNVDDMELAMNDRLHSSHNQMDDLISQGAAVLESLKSQGMGLKGVRRKMMDIGAALGLSSTTLKMIDRRVQEDWVIFLVGCVVTLLFMYVFYRFWKS
ncbi:unnamed protein product [Auanema sp. JU1783]|nr:unnamed protein product [Auanema sp. JU1783]